MYKFFTTLIFLFLTFFVRAQSDTTMYYLDNNGNYLTDNNGAEYIRFVTRDEQNKKYYLVKDYYKTGALKQVAQATEKEGHGLVGAGIEYYKNGHKKVYSVRDATHHIMSYTIYYPNGKQGYTLARKSISRDMLIKDFRDTTGKLIAQDGEGYGIFYNDLDKPDYLSKPYGVITAISTLIYNEWGLFDNIFDENTINLAVETGPIKQGKRNGAWYRVEKKDTVAKMEYRNDLLVSGIGYDNLKNPYVFNKYYESAVLTGEFSNLDEFVKSKLDLKKARKEKVTGQILITCDIEPDGTVSNIKLLKGVGYGLDEQAIDAVEITSNKWQPYKRFGVPQVCHINCSINI